MGITGQGTCLYSSRELKSTDIYHIIHEQYKLNTTINDTTTIRNQPRIAIDTNPVSYPFIFKAVGPTRAVVTIAKKIVEAGIAVIIVRDNKNKRHHTKRATVQKRGVIE